MVDISKIFASNSFNSYPSLEWVNSVGGALKAFGSYISTIPTGLFDLFKVILLGKAIVKMAELFNENANLFANPNVVWIDNLRNILSVFKELPDTDKADGLKEIVKSLNNMSALGVVNIIPILMLAGAIKKLNSALDELNEKNVDKLTQLSKGVMILSIIDDSKLNDVVETLNDKRKELSTVFDEKGSSIIQDILNAKNSSVSTASVGGGTSVTTPKPTQTEEDQSVVVLKEMSEKLDAIIAKMEKVEKAANVSSSLGI
jgi:hypothetical protein